MAKVIILDDCIEALTKVWISNSRGNPSWSSHYHGPALATGMQEICITDISNYDEVCTGFAKVITNSFEQFLQYKAQYDVMCQREYEIEPPNPHMHGYSEYVANLIFRVEGKDCSAHFSGNVPSAPGISSSMALYDWTSSSTVLTKIDDPLVPLIDGHVYRMTLHSTLGGEHNDPPEIVNVLAFVENTSIEIQDQPMICCSGDNIEDRNSKPLPPTLT